MHFQRLRPAPRPGAGVMLRLEVTEQECATYGGSTPSLPCRDSGPLVALVIAVDDGCSEVAWRPAVGPSALTASCRRLIHTTRPPAARRPGDRYPLGYCPPARPATDTRWGIACLPARPPARRPMPVGVLPARPLARPLVGVSEGGLPVWGHPYLRARSHAKHTAASDAQNLCRLDPPFKAGCGFEMTIGTLDY